MVIPNSQWYPEWLSLIKFKLDNTQQCRTNKTEDAWKKNIIRSWTVKSTREGTRGVFVPQTNDPD